jgi:peroxiredoxin
MTIAFPILWYAFAGLMLVSVATAGESTASSNAPKVGDTAPNFVLRTFDDIPVELKQLTVASPVVLVVLRGWPGYHCPLCTRQVQDFLANASGFVQGNAQVVMVYPGPAEKLKDHARAFLGDNQWPANFRLVLDPDFTFTNLYCLRWDAKKETAFPSTFVLERGGRIRFAHISKSHGDRVSAQRAVAELP